MLILRITLEYLEQLCVKTSEGELVCCNHVENHKTFLQQRGELRIENQIKSETFTALATKGIIII